MNTQQQREAWLARTSEPIIEPELQICDAHHHLWEYPNNRYLMNEALADFSAGHRVVKTVYVECLQHYWASGAVELRAVGETEHIDALSRPTQQADEACRVAAGIVGFADLRLGEDVLPILEMHCESSTRFRGIRYATACHSSDKIHNSHTNPPPQLLSDRKFLDGFATLESLNLSFDAWLYHTQLDELVALAKAFPNIKIILNHVGGPLGLGPYRGCRAEVFEAWRAGLTAIADCDNVFVKLGGLNMSIAGFNWQKQPAPPTSIDLAEAITPYFNTCIELFGAQRCMLESNFPVDRVAGSYAVLWNAYKHATARYTDAERASLFYQTAVDVYRLDNL
jgi:predicted TIM-barrel fold metal-dependent hydrolase